MRRSSQLPLTQTGRSREKIGFLLPHYVRVVCDGELHVVLNRTTSSVVTAGHSSTNSSWFASSRHKSGSRPSLKALVAKCPAADRYIKVIYENRKRRAQYLIPLVFYVGSWTMSRVEGAFIRVLSLAPCCSPGGPCASCALIVWDRSNVGRRRPTCVEKVARVAAELGHRLRCVFMVYNVGGHFPLAVSPPVVNSIFRCLRGGGGCPLGDNDPSHHFHVAHPVTRATT